MPGNVRKKLGYGQREKQYLRARRQVLSESQICAICFEAIDLTLKPICCKVDTRGFTVEFAHEIPTSCGDGCRHQKKPNPWSASADHIVPVEQLPAGSPLLTSKKNLRSTHLRCNQVKGAGDGPSREKFVSSGDWF
jgi:hypothetical protein